MYALLRHVRQKTGVTTLHVSHNIEEAIRLARVGKDEDAFDRAELKWTGPGRRPSGAKNPRDEAARALDFPPTTGRPLRARSPAATELSTPPLIATAVSGCCPAVLKMAPVRTATAPPCAGKRSR